MIVDGRQIATEILARARARAATLTHPPKVVAMVGTDTPATRSYLAIKTRRAYDAGCVFEVRSLGANTDDADAVIVQLPLSGGMNTKAILDAIPLEKDADVLSTAAREKGTLLPPVVAAIREIFMRHAVHPEGKNAVVVGQGWLVGEPAAAWLRKQGVHVAVLTSESKDFSALTNADIIVSGAGVPKLIQPDMLKQGVVLIDAATSESSGEIVGDADPVCAAKCSLFTPVPGGVGPIAVAKLFENAVSLAEQKITP